MYLNYVTWDGKSGFPLSWKCDLSYFLYLKLCHMGWQVNIHLSWKYDLYSFVYPKISLGMANLAPLYLGSMICALLF